MLFFTPTKEKHDIIEGRNKNSENILFAIFQHKINIKP
jgi:hypothetical protein